MLAMAYPHGRPLSHAFPAIPSYSRKPGAKSLFERVEFGVARSTRCKLWPALAVDGSTVVFWRLGPGLNQLQTRRASKTIHPSDITSTTTTTASSHNIHLASSLAHSPALSFAAFASPGLCDNHIEHSLTASPASPDSLRRLCLPEDKRAFHNNPRARLSGA